jgi:hypothetical protein
MGSKGGELGAEEVAGAAAPEAAEAASRSACAASPETAMDVRGERGALAGRGAPLPPLPRELRRRELGRLPPESEPVEPPRPWEFGFWGLWCVLIGGVCVWKEVD